jgi:hypothetical protein
MSVGHVTQSEAAGVTVRVALILAATGRDDNDDDDYEQRQTAYTYYQRESFGPRPRSCCTAGVTLHP